MSDRLRLAPAHEVVEAALGASRADGCVVLVNERSSVNARFALNTATSNGMVRSRRVSVISVAHTPKGPAVAVVERSGAVDPVALAGEADALARTAQPALDAAELLGGPYDVDFAEEPAATSHDELSALVTALSGALGEAASRGVDLASFMEHSVETTYLGVSSGLRRRHVERTGLFQLNARGDGGRRSSWSSAATPHMDEIDVAWHVEEVHRRLEWAARRVELDAGRYETILPPDAVADLMVYLYWTLSARDAADGRTVFSGPGGTTRVGERLSSLPFSLVSDPTDADLECAPFLSASASGSSASVFDNGAPLARTAWIQDGTLSRLHAPRADAKRLGLDFAAPIDNVALELAGASGTTEDLVAATERGLLLTCLWYIREVDPKTLLLTGLTRDGVYLVEDGRVTGAVNNFRFNESPVDLLARASEAGESVRSISREWSDYFNRTRTPALRVKDFNMSSVSPAS